MNLAPPAPPHAIAQEAITPAIVVDETTDKTIDAALRFLASRQRADGSWAVNNDDHSVAITAYAVHAFLAAGHVPGEGKHAKTIDRAVAFLLECVRENGYVAAPKGTSNMYGHGIATIVLGEVYGQTRDERVRPALERAVKCIVSAQNEEGGWRYQPRPLDADVSVTVLQLVALRSARNGGVAVPQEVVDRGVAYVRRCYSERRGAFTYRAGNGEGEVGFARTAAAVYSLQVCGLYDDPLVKRGLRFLDAQFVRDNEWWTYGNFYAAPAHYMDGGDGWAKWYPRVRDRLMAEVRFDGEFASWEPFDEGGHGVNTVYATSVYVSILSMPYGYLPLYQR